MNLKEFLEEKDKEKLFDKIFVEIKKLQEKLNPFITISEEQAREHFEANKKNPNFLGIPFSVKDNICTSGIRTTAGSKILENYVPFFDATVIEKIKEVGYIIGKTSMDEFGFGSFNLNCAFGIPKNPLNMERCCGGSSGGAACITKALDSPHIAIAESTGGSISCPASFCGVIGLTPTYGLISRYGLIDYASSLDKIGLIARTCFEVAFGLNLISGFDEKDSTSIKKEKEDYTSYLGKDISKFKIGLPKEYFDCVEEEIKEEIWKAIKKLESEGVKYEEISLPSTKFALPSYYIIAMSEASTNLARYCGIRYGSTLEIKGSYNEFFSEVRGKYFGLEAKRRILMGTFYRKAGYRDKYYIKALRVRKHIINEFKAWFKKFDCILAPTMPTIAPKFVDIAILSPAQHYAMDILTVAPNLAGLPHLSIPCGTSQGMPVGLHIIGNHLQEGKILQLASWLEEL
jgi:aspartyl-tRNA(Asn)/glutamyl-tRNA(Gln) amidotransferase subunit A